MKRQLGLFLAVLLAAFVASSASAQVITVTQFDATAGGVNIQAQWNLGPDPCCPPANVRWIQNIKLKNLDGTPKNDVTGYINRPNFIDPLPDQPPGGWDALPWYDVTYNTAADRTTNTNRQNGAGAFFNDSPNGWGPFGPMDFCAFTAVVCITPSTTGAGGTAKYLGGFSWGFRVAANGTVTKLALAGMPNNAATIGMFNTALQETYSPQSFKDWSMVLGDANCQLTFQPVPEPGTMALCAAAIGIAVKRRRRKVA